jgi:hypothetical protein
MLDGLHTICGGIDNIQWPETSIKDPPITARFSFRPHLLIVIFNPTMELILAISSGGRPAQPTRYG